ncbi:hypothetical protein JL722_5138 [Aureococcus anophagefferens]|nr:hypothetical protein JL722_5138 [Aureococcus anophagefferens]
MRPRLLLLAAAAAAFQSPQPPKRRCSPLAAAAVEQENPLAILGLDEWSIRFFTIDKRRRQAKKLAKKAIIDCHPDTADGGGDVARLQEVLRASKVLDAEEVLNVEGHLDVDCLLDAGARDGPEAGASSEAMASMQQDFVEAAPAKRRSPRSSLWGNSAVPGNHQAATGSKVAEQASAEQTAAEQVAAEQVSASMKQAHVAKVWGNSAVPGNHQAATGTKLGEQASAEQAAAEQVSASVEQERVAEAAPAKAATRDSLPRSSLWGNSAVPRPSSHVVVGRTAAHDRRARTEEAAREAAAKVVANLERLELEQDAAAPVADNVQEDAAAPVVANLERLELKQDAAAPVADNDEAYVPPLDQQARAPALPQRGVDAATLARLAAATRKLERSYAAPTPGDTVQYYASREPPLGAAGARLR